jgi:hypothetical protein
MAMLTGVQAVTDIYTASAGATHEALRVVFPTPLPDLLLSLMNGTHAQSAQFLSNIRGYNSALSMASSGGTIANPPTGISMFAVRGRMYHLIGPPHPVTGQAPRFAQLYIVDRGNQVQARLQHFQADDLHPELLASLQTLLMEHNHYVQQYIQVCHLHVCTQHILPMRS